MANKLKSTETERRKAFAWRCSKCIYRASRIHGNYSGAVTQFVSILRESFHRSVPISECSLHLRKAQEKYFCNVFF